jgi:hypothetical protein
MFDLGGDGRWMWADEIEKKYMGKHVPFFTPYRFPCQPDPRVRQRL